ncbi:hypothetical protein D3C77_523940 [compost metagenome]
MAFAEKRQQFLAVQLRPLCLMTGKGGQQHSLSGAQGNRGIGAQLRAFAPGLG